MKNLLAKGLQNIVKADKEQQNSYEPKRPGIKKGYNNFTTLYLPSIPSRQERKIF